MIHLNQINLFQWITVFKEVAEACETADLYEEVADVHIYAKVDPLTSTVILSTIPGTLQLSISKIIEGVGRVLACCNYDETSAFVINTRKVCHFLLDGSPKPTDEEASQLHFHLGQIRKCQDHFADNKEAVSCPSTFLKALEDDAEEQQELGDMLQQIEPRIEAYEDSFLTWWQIHRLPCFRLEIEDAAELNGPLHKIALALSQSVGHARGAVLTAEIIPFSKKIDRLQRGMQGIFNHHIFKSLEAIFGCKLIRCERFNDLYQQLKTLSFLDYIQSLMDLEEIAPLIEREIGFWDTIAFPAFFRLAFSFPNQEKMSQLILLLLNDEIGVAAFKEGLEKIRAQKASSRPSSSGHDDFKANSRPSSSGHDDFSVSQDGLISKEIACKAAEKFQILVGSPTSLKTKVKITKAYRRFAQKRYPDKVPKEEEEEATKKFQEVLLLYETIMKYFSQSSTTTL